MSGKMVDGVEYPYYCREKNCARWARKDGAFFMDGWKYGTTPIARDIPIRVHFDIHICEDGHRYQVEVFEEELDGVKRGRVAPLDPGAEGGRPLPGLS